MCATDKIISISVYENSHFSFGMLSKYTLKYKIHFISKYVNFWEIFQNTILSKHTLKRTKLRHIFKIFSRIAYALEPLKHMRATIL